MSSSCRRCSDPCVKGSGFERFRAPGSGLQVPIWILGSSLFGAQLAAELGLPYSFASHFMPGALMPALETYRTLFTPSAQLDRPYAMAGVNVFAAATDDEARRLFTSVQQSITNRLRGAPGRLPPPIDDIERTRVDEVMIVSAIYDHAARLRSYEIVANEFLGSD